jgi:hypothetical protein
MLLALDSSTVLESWPADSAGPTAGAETAEAAGMAVVTRGSLVERNALAVNRSKHSMPQIKYPRAQQHLSYVKYHDEAK